MTDKEIADQVYIEPLTVRCVRADHCKRKTGFSVLPTLGGQAGLNLGMELAENPDFWRKYGVKLIGTTAETIFQCGGPSGFQRYYGEDR